MKDSLIPDRGDSDLKARASKILASCDLEEALHQMKLAAQERDREIGASEDVSRGEMFLIRPERARRAKIRWPKAKLR